MSNARIQLGQIATARSGDKGNHANIGVVAFREAGYEFLREQLTADRVEQYFAQLPMTSVERFELPRIWGLNFLLRNSLGGGASRALRIDTQGKLLGSALLQLELPAPSSLAEMTDSSP